MDFCTKAMEMVHKRLCLSNAILTIVEDYSCVASVL